MGAEADADVEGLVEVERNGRAELMHGFALQADEDGKGIAVLFEADAFGMDAGEQAGETILEVLHEDVFVAAEGEMDHAGAVLADHGCFGSVVKTLADDENDLAVAEALGVGKETSAAMETSPDIFFQR